MSDELRSLNLNLLVALDAMLAECSVSRAAERVGQSQPSMSRALARLRKVFGDPLIVRAGQGWVRTERAERLVVPIAKALDELRRAVSDDDHFAPERATTKFRLALSDYMSIALLPRLFARLATEAPSVDLQVVSPGRPFATALTEGDWDLYLAAEPTEGPGLYSQRIFDDEMVSVIRRGHPHVKRSLSLEHFVNLDHVLVTPRETDHGGYVDRELARQGLKRRIALRVPQFLVATSVIATTDFVLTIPRRIAEFAATSRQIRLLPPPIDLPVVSARQVWHERRHRDRGHQWLRRLIRSVCATD